MNKQSALAAITFLGALCATGLAQSQIAGSTTSTNLAVTESTQVARGWSVKKTLLGKAVDNDVGQKIGTVEDLIIAPTRNVSYVIVGAGGFVGLGRHEKSAETKLAEMKLATANRWKEFEAGVSAATARLRKVVDVATG